VALQQKGDLRLINRLELLHQAKSKIFVFKVEVVNADYRISGLPDVASSEVQLQRNKVEEAGGRGCILGGRREGAPVQGRRFRSLAAIPAATSPAVARVLRLAAVLAAAVLAAAALALGLLALRPPGREDRSPAPASRRSSSRRPSSRPPSSHRPLHRPLCCRLLQAAGGSPPWEEEVEVNLAALMMIMMIMMMIAGAGHKMGHKTSDSYKTGDSDSQVT
jgi:hypothetical protein